MKKYWKDIETKKRKGEIRGMEKTSDENALFELLSDSGKDLQSSRRDFLKLCGFSFAVTALSSCQSKISKAVPYVIAPSEITPGEALYYASSYINGNDYCSIIVKTRDGRPIKIEGNPESGITMGGTSARVQASVLDLESGSFCSMGINRYGNNQQTAENNRRKWYNSPSYTNYFQSLYRSCNLRVSEKNQGLRMGAV